MHPKNEEAQICFAYSLNIALFTRLMTTYLSLRNAPERRTPAQYFVLLRVPNSTPLGCPWHRGSGGCKSEPNPGPKFQRLRLVIQETSA